MVERLAIPLGPAKWEVREWSGNWGQSYVVFFGLRRLA